MRKIILLLVLLCFFNTSSAQAIWNWAAGATTPTTGSLGSEGMSGTRDVNGNFYICGLFYGSSIAFGSNTLTSQLPQGSYNMYLAKYSPTGVPLWATGAVNPTVLTSANNVSTDGLGNVYLIGQFSSTIVIGTYTLISQGNDDVYLAKYNGSGALQWVLQGNGIGFETIYGVCADATGNCYITGSTSSGVTTWGTYTLATSGAGESYFLKIGSTGNVIWGTSSASSSGNAAGRSLALDPSGNIYWSGYFGGTTSFGTATINSTGGQDAYLAKYTPAGSMVWAVNSTTGTANEYAFALGVDANGNPYVGGYYTGSLAIGSQTYAPAVGFSDAFLAKFNASGVAQWSRIYKGNGAGGDKVWSISSYTGGIYVAGNASPNFTMSGVVYPSTSFTGDEAFVEHIDLNGNTLYSNIVHGGGDDQLAIMADDACSIYLTSDYAVSIPTPNYTLTLPPGIGEVAFIAKLTFPPNVVFSGNIICAGNNATITASGANTYTWSANAGASNSPSVVVSPVASTVYSISATNQCGQSNATVMVLVNPNPSVSITASSNSVCPGNTVVLFANGTSSVSWSNSITNGTAFAPTATAVYTATGTNTLNCSSTATVQVRLLNLPLITPAASASAICPGQSATLSAGSPGSYTWQPGGSNQASLTVSPLITQTYSVSRIDSTCVNTATISLQVLPKPAVLVVSNRTLVCAAEHVTLTASGASTYTWNTGAISPTINPVSNLSTTIVYTVTGTGSNGCSNTATIAVKVIPCMGLTDNNESEQINVYPNPSAGDLTIEFPNQNTSVLIYDAFGRVIKELELNEANGYKIKVNGLASGIYFVSALAQQKMLVNKIIVQPKEY